MTSKQFVPASRSDIKPGARIMVRYDHDHRPAKDVDCITGRATCNGSMIRGNLYFWLNVVEHLPSMRVRHGDYTGTELWVEVETEARIASYMGALKRGYKARERTVDVTLVGGPLDGAQVPLTACHTPWLTLHITCKGETGRYQSGRWVPGHPNG